MQLRTNAKSAQEMQFCIKIWFKTILLREVNNGSAENVNYSGKYLRFQYNLCPLSTAVKVKNKPDNCDSY